MSNIAHEQTLIDNFVSELFNHTNSNIRISEIYNNNCKSKTYADIEYISDSGKYWVIEAKSHISADKYNTVHKIFGELLKETGRDSRNNVSYSILIPEEGITFYSRLFQEIKKEKFIGFGDLIPIECVFTFGASGVAQITWEALYDSYNS